MKKILWIRVKKLSGKDLDIAGKLYGVERKRILSKFFFIKFFRTEKDNEFRHRILQKIRNIFLG